MNLDPGEIVRDPDLELPYEQEVHEATGNEGVSVDRWYHEAVVVLWPRSLYVDLLAREGRALAVPALAEMIKERGGLDGHAERLRFAAAILDHWKRRHPYEHLKDDVTSQMLRCRYDLREILVPAAVDIHAERNPDLDADPAVRRLHEHVVAELLAATVSAPEAPIDWRQAVTLSHRCADCLELEAFANDPEAQVHHFKVGKDRRRHLHDQINRADHEGGRLYMTHITERSGNPHTLVCTKTRAGYQLAVERYESDLYVLEALEAGRG